MLAMINVYFMSVYFEILVLFLLASEKIRKNTTMNVIEILKCSLLQSFGNNDSLVFRQMYFAALFVEQECTTKSSENKKNICILMKII